MKFHVRITHECQFYEQIYMWNEKCASVVNQMPTSVQEDYEEHSIWDTQQNSPLSTIKEKRKEKQKTRWKDFWNK